LRNSAQELLTFFHIGLRLPNSSFWVNLRPDSPQEIIDLDLEKTDIGRIMLEADVQLKKDLACYTNPNTAEGRQYWDRLYAKVEELFGQSDISIPTVTRPWIVPNEIILRDAGTSAYIYKATLKVMLESDHLPSTEYAFEDPRLKQLNDYSSELIRQLILPALSRDVNVAKRYAALRQVYYSLILAQWFKAKYKGERSPVTRHTSHVESDALMSGIDTRDLRNLESRQRWAKEAYFKVYKKSFEHGEYNLQENRQTPYGIIVRQYVSGGVEFQSIIDLVTVKAQHAASFLFDLKNTAVLEVTQAGFVSAAQDGGTVMLTDPSKRSELQRIYAKIEDARQRLARPPGIVERIKNRFIKDMQPVQIGDGSFAHVYWLPEYPDLVFKVFRKDYEVQEFDAQVARMADIAETLPHRKGSINGFELVSVYQLAPFVYCKLTDTQGKPVGIIAQQKAEMPVEPGDLDRLNREMDPELVWHDQRNTNAGYIEDRAVITDFSSLFLKKHLAREKQVHGVSPAASRGPAAQDGGKGKTAEAPREQTLNNVEGEEYFKSVDSLREIENILEEEKDLQGAWIYFDVDDTLMYQAWNYPGQNFISMITAIRERALAASGQAATKENVFDEIIRRWQRMEDARFSAGLLKKVDGVDELWQYASDRGMKIGISTIRPEAMRDITMKKMKAVGIDTGRVHTSIFVGFGNGKGTQILSTINGSAPKKIFLVDNNKAHVTAFVSQMSGNGIPVKAFWLTEEQQAQQDKDDSLANYWDVAEGLIGMPVSAAEPERDLALMEVALVTVLLKVAELPHVLRSAEIERIRAFLDSRSFTYFLSVRGDTQEDFLGRSYLDRYLQEMESPLKGSQDGGRIAEEIPGYDPARIADLVVTFPTFKKYMETVLYDQTWGYYGSGNVGFGWEQKDGRSVRLDFNTFPKMLSPDFGRLWADQVFRIYQNMRQAGLLSPEEEFRIIEFGAGDGTLAKDMLDYFSLMSSKEQGQWQELWQRLQYTIGEHSPALRDRQQETLASLTGTAKVKIRDADARTPEALLEGKAFKGAIISNELVDAFGFHRVRVGKGFSDNGVFQICLTVPVFRLGRFKELQSIDNDLAQEILKTHNAIAATLGQASETEAPLLDIYLSYENFLKLKDLGAARQQEDVKEIIDQGVRFKEVFIDPAQFVSGQKQADTYADSDSEKLKEFTREVEQVRDYLERNKSSIIERLRRNDGPVVINVNPGIREYVREVAAILNKKDNAGYVMTVDYGGDPYSVLALGAREDRIITMFQGYDPQYPDDNPYKNPGKRDITAVVNARELLADELPLVWYAHQASLLPEDPRRLKELWERYPAAFLNLIDEPGKTTNFFLMIQASSAIPEQARYQFPFYGKKWGLSRGLPLQPDELLFLDPKKMEAMRAELEQGLREVTLGHIRKEDFPESMQANWQDYSDPQGIIFYLFRWAGDRQELSHRLFPYLTRDPEEAVAVLDFLKQKGVVRTGISSWHDKDNGRKNDVFETAFEKNDYGASEPSGSDLQSGTDLSQAGAPLNSLTTQKQDGGKQAGEKDEGLQRDILEQTKATGFAQIDVFAIDSIKILKDAIAANKVVVLRFPAHVFQAPEGYRMLGNKFRYLAGYLISGLGLAVTRENSGRVMEVLKNAFVHGNKMDYQLPMYIYVDRAERQLAVYDTAAVKENPFPAELLLMAGWAGEGKGLKGINADSTFDYQRTLLPEGKGTRAIVSLKDRPGGRDGGQERGDVAGIDFRALPVNAAPAVAPTAFMLPAEQLIPAPEMENTWKEIENMVSRGVIPPGDRLKQYAATCWRNNSFAQHREKLLACVADILRLQEDQNLTTEPALQDLLVLLESK